MRSWWVLIVLLLVAPRGAQAQPAASQVTTILRRGVGLRQRGQDQAALDQFRQALRISREPRVIAQIALAEQALEHWVDASRHLREALAASEDDYISRHRAEFEPALREIERHLGTLMVTGGAPGAEVWIGDLRAADLPMREPLRLLPGQVTVEIRATGFRTEMRTAVVEQGEQTAVFVMMARENSAMETGGARVSGTVAPLGRRATETRGCVPGAQVACACPGSRSGVQVCDASGDFLRECQCSALGRRAQVTPNLGLELTTTLPGRTVRRWYGWQTLLVDGVSIGVTAIGIGIDNPPLYVVGGLASFLGPAITHWAHGNIGFGFLSMGLRLAGSLMAVFSNGNALIYVGAAVEVGAVVLDAAVFGFDEVFPSARRSTYRGGTTGWSLGVSPLQGGFTCGFAARL